MVQKGVRGEEPYLQPHRVCQWMFSVENWGGAGDVDDVGGGVLDLTLARDGLEVLLHRALDRLLCRDAINGGPGGGRACQRCVLHIALHCITAPTTDELYRLHGVAEASGELCSENPAHVLVEALQRLSLWAWSGQLCPGGLERGAEDLYRLLMGDGATIKSRE